MITEMITIANSKIGFKMKYMASGFSSPPVSVLSLFCAIFCLTALSKALYKIAVSSMNDWYKYYGTVNSVYRNTKSLQ